MNALRYNVILGAMGILAVAIISRLFYLQVMNGQFYSAQALGQQSGFAEITGDRGEIFATQSKESRGVAGSLDVKSLAINRDEWIISAVPNSMKDKVASAKSLASVIDETKEFILTKLQSSSTYVIIQKDATAGEVDALKKLKIEGVSFERRPARYYPQERLASQVIGFVGGNNVGQYGLEGYYEDLLKGKRGIKEDKRGFDIINGGDSNQSLNGSSLYLTLDYNIQFQAEALLKEAKKNIDIDSGQIIVLKPDSGRVLALANFPSFDVNEYSREKGYEVFQNSTVQKIFEPGSIFKPFTMAMALNEGKVTPETTFTDTGSVTIGKDTLYNFSHEKYNLSDMSRILEKSINTGAVFLSQQVSRQTFLDYLDSFGLLRKTEIGLQGEVYSKNDYLRRGSEFGFATASFGQGIEMTPIQLARSFSIFANGGMLPKPYIVDKIVHDNDEQITKPEVLGPVISPKTASQVTTMLINVVEKGFGNLARIPGYYLAGKTGTAEVPIEGKGGYYNDRTVQSFVGFGPALKPQFLILVKLDNPKVPKSSLSAAPIFKKLAQYIINYWQIPPDYTGTSPIK